MASNISLRHLRCFLAVAQCRSFTQASARLFITQSALTAAVQQLEEAVGLRLFDRTTRSVELTREAEAFLPQADKIVRDFDGAIGDLRSIAQSRSGEVRIAAAHSIIEVFLAEAISLFQEEYPGIRFTLREHGAERSEQLVANGEVDFALAERFRGLDELDYQPLFRDQFGIMSSEPLTTDQQRSLRLTDLPRSGYVAFTADTGIGTYLASHAPQALEWCAPGDQVSSTMALFSVLQRRAGYSIIPALPAMIGQRLGLHFCPLQDPVLSRQIDLISRKLRTLSPTSDKLLRTLRQVIAQKASTAVGVTSVEPVAR